MGSDLTVKKIRFNADGVGWDHSLRTLSIVAQSARTASDRSADLVIYPLALPMPRDLRQSCRCIVSCAILIITAHSAEDPTVTEKYRKLCSELTGVDDDEKFDFTLVPKSECCSNALNCIMLIESLTIYLRHAAATVRRQQARI